MTMVGDLMTRSVQALSPRDMAWQAARVMDRYNVGIVPVCDRGRLLGVVTERDIAVRAIARGLPVETTPLGQLMSVDVQSCFDDESLDDVLAHLGEPHASRLPVLDRAGHFLGMLSLGAVAAPR